MMTIVSIRRATKNDAKDLCRPTRKESMVYI